MMTYQKIFYGAPGTGKSFKIDDILKQKSISPEFVFRVTFHPEYSYSDFIGQLLPKVVDKPDGSKEITYDFSKGVFTQALEKAYEDTSKDVYLILEEMSRGDVAAIFGDIFQLLDRISTGTQKGYSRYFVNNDIVAKDIIAIIDNKIKLSPNLFILGTVNTSDQNVFVMDTAFKRRFDWEYISVKPVKNDTGTSYLNNPNINVILTDSTPQEKQWAQFYMGLNKFISHKDYLELGEDKQIGQFFIEFDNASSPEMIKDKIQNKLLQYLWNDVQKASFKRNISLFSKSISSFSELYDNYNDDKCVFSAEFLECLNNTTV
jgi:5-methylcytosine-specific restriction endonuclease McrBC GTP-binding regulatory subunit McrB